MNLDWGEIKWSDKWKHDKENVLLLEKYLNQIKENDNLPIVWYCISDAI